jgi:membrane-associated phospholipid phosphatase
MTSANGSLWQRRLPPHVFWGLLAVCCLACPIAYLLLDKPVLDWQMRRGFVQFSHPAIDAFRLLGKAWLLVWLLLVWVAATGRRQLALLALSALLVLAVPVNSIKVLAGRPRPREKIAAAQATPTSPQDTQLRGLSFPSGDTASALAVAAALSTALAWPWAAAALVAACGVGVMRVVDLAHHPSDVCAGAALGILAALVAVRLMRYGSPPAIEVWGRPVALLATIGIPTVIRFTHGTAVLQIVLKTYVPLVLAIYILAAAYRRVRAAAMIRSDE